MSNVWFKDVEVRILVGPYVASNVAHGICPLDRPSGPYAVLKLEFRVKHWIKSVIGV